MKNPIRWLFENPSIEKAEKELDKQFIRIAKKIRESEKSVPVEINIDFPKEFTEQSNAIAIGSLEWRDFYSNESLDIYSVHCRMTEGTLIRKHRHPNFDEYIYVVSGQIINWMDSDNGKSIESKIITPPEEVNKVEEAVEGWYKIEAGRSHRIQATKSNTHLISKFLRPNGWSNK